MKATARPSGSWADSRSNQHGANLNMAHIYPVGLALASFIDLHKKKGARNRQRQHRTKTGKSEGFNDSQENQIWLKAMLNETDDLLVLHGLLGSDCKIAAERTHQNLS